MTTDLLLTVRRPASGNEGLVAVCVKPSKLLDDMRVLEKLEIERRYWVGRSAGFTIFTERQVSKKRVLALLRLRTARRLDILREGEAFWLDIAGRVLEAFPAAEERSVVDFASRMDRENGWDKGRALFAVSHLSAVRELLIDPETFDTNGPLAQLALPAGPDVRRFAA